MKIASRLPVLAAVAAAALALAGAGTAVASAAPAAGHAAAVTSGTKLWEARYAADGRGAFGDASALSPDGSTLFVTGGSTRKVHERGATAGTTIAYNATTGARLWQASYNPGGLSLSEFSSIAVDPDGSKVFVAGGTQPASGKAGPVVVVAYDASTGAAAWTDTPTIGGPASAVAVSPDGATVFIIAGQVTAAYSAATGAPLWTANLGAQAFTTGLSVSPDGSTVFLAATIGSTDTLVAYNAATGAARWSTTLVNLAPKSLAVSPDGSKVVVTGYWGGEAGSSTALARTAAFDAATGATLWTKTSKSPNGGSYGSAVTVSPDSSTIFVTGSTTTASKHEVVATWAYDAATGATLWLKTLSGLGTGNVIAVSPDGSTVFVGADASGFSAAQAFTTVAYNAASGAQQWFLGYRFPSGAWHSFAFSMEVSPDGSGVYVTGDLNTPEPGAIPTLAAVAYSS